NVALLLFDGQAQWFHSIDSEVLVRALYDHVDAMLAADGCLPAPPALAPYHFTASAWQPRPDGQPVDDFRPRRQAVNGQGHGLRESETDVACHEPDTVESTACHVTPATC